LERNPMVSWILSCLLLAAVNGQTDCTIVYFGSANCAPCEKIVPALEQLKREGWDIRAVNAPSRPDLATQYKIDNLPTVVIVSQQGQREVDRVVGAVNYEQLLSRFTRAATRLSTNSTASAKTPPAQASANTQVAPQANWELNQQQQVAAGPTVRGQSPAAGGFPLLGAASAAAASAVNASAASAFATPTVDTVQQLTAQQLTAQPQLAAQQQLTAQPISAAPQPLSLEQAIARAAAATVRIKVEEENTTAYGTGTIVDVHGSEALVLTCGHLFRDMKPGSQLSVDLFAGSAQETNALARLIDFKAEDEDIGLISFTLPVAIEAVELLPRHSKLQVGQPAFSFGCDHGQPPTRRDTQIRSIDRYLGAANVEIVGAPAVGRSGGGLFDQQGRLIGVCNAACTEEDEGIYAAAEVVYTQIARLGLSHLFDGKPTGSPQMVAALGATHPGGQSQLTAPVQSASFAQPAANASAAAAWTGPVAEDNIRWPDQLGASSQTPTPSQTHVPNQNIEPVRLSQNSVGLPNAVSGGGNPHELICIVRDASGQSRVVTIPGPAPELLQAIQQHSSGALNR
jgi:thioredoxin-like negative regulator of GroEL